MSDIGDVILNKISSELVELENNIKNSSTFNFSVIEKHERSLSTLQSKLDKWHDDVSHFSKDDQNKISQKYKERINSIRQKFSLIQSQISSKSRVKDWAENFARVSKFVSAVNAFINVYNMIARLFGLPEFPDLKHILPAPAQKMIEHSSRTLHADRYDKIFKPR